jgi:hypothetical protein
MTKYWQNQTVKMQSAIGAAIAITSISKANPAVVATAGTLPAVDAYVLLEVTGMRQVNNKVFKVSVSGSGEFTINADSTQYDDFSTGTFRLLTIDTFFSGLRDPNSSGGDPVFEDTTTIHGVEDTQDVVSSSPQTMSFTNDWDPTDPALRECNLAFVTRTPRAFVMVDPDDSEYMFYATVSAPLNPTVSGRKKVTPLNLALKASGTVI